MDHQHVLTLQQNHQEWRTINDHHEQYKQRQSYQHTCGRKKDEKRHKKKKEKQEENVWFNQVLDFEIQPLLEEIWFDDSEKVREMMKILWIN